MLLQQINSLLTKKPAIPNRPMVVITNYHKLMKSITGHYKVYEDVEWSLVVCDEAHFLRNINTQKTGQAFKLQRQAGLLITGM
jgi:SNF2 family DNA or RNA helicase